MSRTPREIETREKETRTVMWRPASDLPVPTPQDGYTFRWVRTAIMGQSDPRNMAKFKAEGWVVCKAADHPEMITEFNAHDIKPNDPIEIGGLMLCKTTKELSDAQKEYYERLANAQMESVDNNFMKEQDPRMPLFADRKSTTSFGRGF